MNKKIEELYNKIDGLNSIIDQQALEIARLNNEIQIRIKSIEKLEKDIIEYQRDRIRLKEELETLKDNMGFNLCAIEHIRKENHKLEEKIDKVIEYIKNGIDFKSLHFIKGKDEDMWKIILVENVKNELLEILGDKE